MTEGPPKGKEHRKPELYYDGVLKGPALWQSNVRKPLFFPKGSCNVEQARLCNVMLVIFYEFYLLCGRYLY